MYIHQLATDMEGRACRAVQIVSLSHAMQLAMYKLHLSGGQGMQTTRVSQAFNFVDADGSGQVQGNPGRSLLQVAVRLLEC